MYECQYWSKFRRLYFYWGAGKNADAKPIEESEHITPVQISNHFVVGADHEANILRIVLEDYFRRNCWCYEGSTII